MLSPTPALDGSRYRSKIAIGTRRSRWIRAGGDPPPPSDPFETFVLRGSRSRVRYRWREEKDIDRGGSGPRRGPSEPYHGWREETPLPLPFGVERRARLEAGRAMAMDWHVALQRPRRTGGGAWTVPGTWSSAHVGKAARFPWPWTPPDEDWPHQTLSTRSDERSHVADTRTRAPSDG